MPFPQFSHPYVLALFLLLLTGGCATVQTDPLPAWNDGKTKQAIVSFVAGVTTQGSPDYVPVPERIATFDNDGTRPEESSSCCLPGGGAYECRYRVAEKDKGPQTARAAALCPFGIPWLPDQGSNLGPAD
jgi:hypothetical protein